MRYNTTTNLVIVQKSKVMDWIEHFKNNYHINVYNLTKPKDYLAFLTDEDRRVGIVTYDIVRNRKELYDLRDFTMMLDESSMIKTDSTKRTKSILRLKPLHTILLSGTPSGGKYENMYSQLKLLGWNGTKSKYNSTFINYTTIYVGGFPRKVIDMDNPYKNEKLLNQTLRDNGAIYMKTEEVLDLPEQNFNVIKVRNTRNYSKFLRDDYIDLGDVELIGDSTMAQRLYARQLCSAYNKNKLEVVKDLISSTDDRIIIFYNWNCEYEKLIEVIDKPISVVNGSKKDLTNYENESNSVTLIQYQSGAKGLNLQKANKIIYFSLTDSSEDFEQSKKRIHRIGQNQTCFYYILETENSVEEVIYKCLERKRDYDNDLFKEYKREVSK